MRLIRFITVPLALFVISMAIAAQKRSASAAGLEQTIRALDLEAARAVLDHNEKSIARLFAANSVTNNPRNGLTKGSAGVIEAAGNGLVDYYKFEREVRTDTRQRGHHYGPREYRDEKRARRGRHDVQPPLYQCLDEKWQEMADRSTSGKHYLPVTSIPEIL